jgi:hypothetical protein
MPSKRRPLWAVTVGGPLDGNRYRFGSDIPATLTFQALIDGRWHSDDYVRAPGEPVAGKPTTTAFHWAEHDCPRIIAPMERLNG